MRKGALILMVLLLIVNSSYAITGITGVPGVCIGGTRTLSNSTVGGTWSSSNIGKATISSAGVVTGVAAGTSVISYNVSGAIATVVVTVNAPLPAITGTTTVCGLENTTLANTMPGGIWSSASPGVGSVNAYGVVRANSPGPDTVTILYTMPGTGCRTSALLTINDHPFLILFGSFCAPTTFLCIGSSAGFAVATSTGSVAGMLWSSSNPSVANVSLDGTVHANSPGTTNISLTTPQGCSVSAAISVPALTPAINGTLSTCAGRTTNLTNSMGGGTWSSSAPTVATINTVGVVTGVAAGTAHIVYIANGCPTTSTVTVNSVPTAITGTLTACPGTTTTLNNTLAGGTWSSSNSGVATVGASTGIVTGVAAGTTVISYTTSAGCGKSVIVTINAIPVIGGTRTVCSGKTTALTCIPAATSWSGNNTAIATVMSGLVTGVSGGVAVITATAATGCKAIANVTVNALPSTISGTLATCAGSTTNLSNTMTGGTWASSMPGTASISSSGAVTGVLPGYSTISYTSAAGCLRTGVVTVNALPTITGMPSVCVGTAATLSGLAMGGVWTSSTVSKVSVGSTGIVTGVSAGTSIISYTLANGCRKTIVATVNTTPGAIIGGTSSLCSGTTTTLGNSLPGGTWSSSFPGVATIGTTGNVAGMAAGTALISYTYGTCRATRVVTVLPLPAAIAGIARACPGTTTTLINTTIGGTWSSSNAGFATVNTTGLVTGVAAGTANIIYTLPNSCSKSVVATINPNPTSIAGTLAVCQASTTTLANATSGFLSWTSSDPTKATVGPTGIVTGVTAGTSKITYKVATGCLTTAVVTVNALPAAITGTLTVCPGTTTTLSNTTIGGTWSSSNTAKAIVGATTGIVTGVTAGTAAIVYTTPAGCTKSVIVTVNVIPTVGGSLAVCAGKTTVLTCTPLASLWSSSSTTTATVMSGVVTGVAGGTAIITATAPTGCKSMATVTVNSLPATISGTLATCVGSTTNLSNTMTGGTWASSMPGVASISSSGVVTGALPGNSTISYTSAAGCLRTGIFTVNALPTISGTPSVCVGTAATLSGLAMGGTWASSTSKATVGSTGVVTGVSAGTATISYTLANGCRRTIVATVNTTPAAISGTASLCSGSTTTLSNSLPGGAWSSGSTLFATVGSTGNVTGVNAGTTTITYAYGTCKALRVVTVLALPGAIAGIAKACPGTTATLSNATVGGVWSSSVPGIATMATNGVLSGVSAGTANIIYTLPNACSKSVVATVNPNPTSITGTLAVCQASTTTLANATSGLLSWTSSDPTKATVSTTGVVAGVAAGTSKITYKVTTGCLTTAIVTVNALPATITGSLIACSGTTTTLSNTTIGGTWTSGATAVGTINASGVVTGIAGGTSVISYSLPSGCKRTLIVTINQSPATIAGLATICKTATTSLSSTGAGAWSSLSPTIVSVAATGVATGINAGTGTVAFTAPNGCKATKVVTVNICGSREITTEVPTAEFSTPISMFPNPTNGMFTFQTSEAGTLSVLAVDGKEVASYSVKEGDTSIVLPKNLAAGVYLCRFNGNEGGGAMVRMIYQP